MTRPPSSLTAGGVQYAVDATGNMLNSEAGTNPKPCSATCSNNGTHSDGYTGAFEGPEKLLEMWFAPRPEAVQHVVGQSGSTLPSDEDQDEFFEQRSGLRLVPRAEWRRMLELVHCQVLSTLCNEYLDSYLLSESSFFVYPHKLVLKTCGTTTLLYAVPRILQIAKAYLGVDGVYQFFYSRKNFMFPAEQVELHQSWTSEVAYLDARFPDGAAYMIGKTNGDHWHAYLSGPHEPPQGLADDQRSADATLNNSVAGSPMAGSPALSRCSSRATMLGVMPAAGAKADVTVEILMTGLDPERMRHMHLGGVSSEEGPAGGKAVERATGISAIYPASSSDSHLFAPCGFSLNGLQGEGYYTIHVTPEQHCSYASFETNISDDDAFDLRDPVAIKALVEKVAAVFGPQFVTATVFKARTDSGKFQTAESALVAAAQSASGIKEGLTKAAIQLANDMAPPSFAPIDGYKLVDRVLYEFDHYWLRYAYYKRAD
ncbi:spermidine resistance protein [Coemansia biformis]|uniref:Spermidine resistance protein n=1 Tax=Coemansia biformis TaxID=1286918 RepID=A0A9W8D1N0_9FUNG|nr:spermidine resistance protein [Coemansia biformis]